MVLEAILMGMGTLMGNSVRNQIVLFVWKSDEKEFPLTFDNLPKIPLVQPQGLIDNPGKTFFCC